MSQEKCETQRRGCLCMPSNQGLLGNYRKPHVSSVCPSTWRHVGLRGYRCKGRHSSTCYRVPSCHHKAIPRFMLLLWEETQWTLIPEPSEWKATALRREVIKWGPHTSAQGAVQSANTANTVLAETSTHGFLSANGTLFPQTHSGQTGPPESRAINCFNLPLRVCGFVICGGACPSFQGGHYLCK